MKRVLFCLFVLSSFLAGCHSPVYTIEPFEAWAIDWETGEPIEGANVVATWALFEGTFHGHHFREMLAVKETVTDKNGRFSFAGFKLYNPRMYELMEDPKIIIFKPGYQYVRRINGCRLSAAGDCRWATRIAVVAGERVKMKKLDYSKARKSDGPLRGHEREMYSGLSTDIDYVKESCNVKRIPLFLRSVEEEAERLAADGFYGRNGLPTTHGTDRHESSCGIAKHPTKG